MIEVSDNFHRLANAGIRPLNWKTAIGWQDKSITTSLNKNLAVILLPSPTTYNRTTVSYSSETGLIKFENNSQQQPQNAIIRLDQSTATGSDNLRKYSGTYTLSISDIQSDGNSNVEIGLADSEGNTLISVDKDNTTATGIVDSANCYIYAKIDENTFYSYFYCKIQLEEGTTATEYVIPDPVIRKETENLSNRAIAVSVSRSFDFPYMIQSAIADISLDNHDGYLSFTGRNTSPIANSILPNRILEIGFGFGNELPAMNFQGRTDGMPTYDGDHDQVMKWTAFDRIAEISRTHLPNMVMLQNARTDQVIQAIFQQLGLSPAEYRLEEGKNIIPFVYFDSDKSVGNALRELLQAEDGRMWQDENGIIRFQARRSNAFAELTDMLFNSTNIIQLTPSREARIVNTVNISAEIRAVQSRQQIFTNTNDRGYQSAAKDDAYRVPANGTATVWLQFEDPIWSAETPIFNGSANQSRFTAVDLTGTRITSGVSIQGTLFAKTYKAVFTNTRSSAVSISSIVIFGRPAKLVGGQNTEYFAYDDTSVEKFGNLTQTIENNTCFGSADNLRAYGQSLLKKYSDYNRQIVIKVKGDPSLQLGDGVSVDYEDFQGYYEVVAISNTIDNVSDSKLETELTLDFVASGSPFTLDVSILNGGDILG